MSPFYILGAGRPHSGRTMAVVRVLVALGLLLQAAGALTSFDCSKPGPRLAAVGLVDVAPCGPPDATVPPPALREVQVVQMRNFNKIRVRTCHVELERRLYYCPSYTFGNNRNFGEVLGGRDTNIHWLTPGACDEMHTRGTASIYGNPISGLRVNEEVNDRWLTIRGSFQNDASCHGMWFGYNGHNYERIAAAGNARIALRTLEARVDLKEDTVVLPSGGVCSYRGGSCRDVTEGNVLWDYEPMDDCGEHRLDVLYSGPANLTAAGGNSSYLSVLSGTTLAALMVRTDDPSPLCEATAYPTQDPRVLVLLREDGQGPLPFTKKEMDPDNVDMMYHVNAMSLFLERWARERALLAAHEHCERERARLREALLLARVSPAAAARLVMGGSPGYTGVVRGDVLYVAQCEARDLPLRVADRCYLQIPVWDGDAPAFAEPATRALVPASAATEVDCDSVLLPVHYIDDQWVAFTPNITNVTVPVQRLGAAPQPPILAPLADFLGRDPEIINDPNDPKVMNDLLSVFGYPAGVRNDSAALSDSTILNDSAILIDRTFPNDNTILNLDSARLFDSFLSSVETFGSYCSIFVTVCILVLALRSTVKWIMRRRLLFVAIWRSFAEAFVFEHVYVVQNEKLPDCDTGMRKDTVAGEALSDNQCDRGDDFEEFELDKVSPCANATK